MVFFQFEGAAGFGPLHFPRCIKLKFSKDSAEQISSPIGFSGSG